MENKISIIIPAYNVREYVGDTIESVLAQSYQNLEIIAVDDGSTDGTEEIIDRYAAKDSRIKVIHQENSGVTAARLRGVREAAGEWIGFVDGDDAIDPDMYEQLLRNALEHRADISHCGYRMVFPDGRVNEFYNTGILVKQDRVTALKELLSGKRIEPSLCSKLFRKELFHRLLHDNLLDVNIRNNEDLLMNYWLLTTANALVFEDLCLYHYIIRKDSASRAKLNKHKIYDPIHVKEIILQTAPVEIRKDAQRAYLNTCINVFHSLITDKTNRKEDTENVRRLLRQNKEHFMLLGRKKKIIAEWIIGAPISYASVYRFYSRYLRRSIYT